MKKLFPCYWRKMVKHPLRQLLCPQIRKLPNKHNALKSGLKYCFHFACRPSSLSALGMEFLKVFKEWSGGRDPGFAKLHVSHFPLLLTCCAALPALLPQLWGHIVLTVCPLTPVLAEDLAQSLGSGGSGWILGKISVLEDWLSIGTSFLVKKQSHYSYKCPKKE